MNHSAAPFGCSPKAFNFVLRVSRLSPSQRAALAWFPRARLTASARHAGHAFEQRPGGGQPRARLEFTVAAVVAQLNIKAAERGGFAEHVALDSAGAIPGGLAAGGGIHREH